MPMMPSKLFSKTSDAEDGVHTDPLTIPSSAAVHGDLMAYTTFLTCRRMWRLTAH